MLVVEAPAFEDPRAGRIQAYDGDLIVSVERLKVGRDIALVFVEPPHSVPRDCRAAHRDSHGTTICGLGNASRKARAARNSRERGALGEVARHHHHIRLIAGDGGEQGWDKRRITAPKMESDRWTSVRMGSLPRGPGPGYVVTGTITRKAPGRIR